MHHNDRLSVNYFDWIAEQCFDTKLAGSRKQGGTGEMSTCFVDYNKTFGV